ncbi:YpiB family protein [Hazenella sp. IB182357]|uniref:YpiB family protein n=1 Tax=Polycladospora coralii TaxID=2771432 RepID=A0A926NDK1_9BACL|nr:YpiB family protein [Polycladospora coralii]MBD1371604.1 YpiB family protein [Polycladospora coralii]MBS7529071.1 YpiB family protein [Polycladospora coralii]
MRNMISVAEKKEFINWFLEHYELQKKEAAWLLSYLSSNEKLLTKVHFVEHTRHLARSLIISTKCSNMAAFKFIKNKRVGSDVESAFYDIRSYPHDDLYIGLYFKDRTVCSKYAAVLEVHPMRKHEIAQDHLLELFAEMILDQSIKTYRQHTLYEQIDQALVAGDRDAFMQLSKQYNASLE